MFSTGTIAQARGPRLSIKLYDRTRIFTVCMYYVCVLACLSDLKYWFWKL